MTASDGTRASIGARVPRQASALAPSYGEVTGVFGSNGNGQRHRISTVEGPRLVQHLALDDQEKVDQLWHIGSRVADHCRGLPQRLDLDRGRHGRQWRNPTGRHHTSAEPPSQTAANMILALVGSVAAGHQRVIQKPMHLLPGLGVVDRAGLVARCRNKRRCSGARHCAKLRDFRPAGHGRSDRHKDRSGSQATVGPGSAFSGPARILRPSRIG